MKRPANKRGLLRLVLYILTLLLAIATAVVRFLGYEDIGAIMTTATAQLGGVIGLTAALHIPEAPDQKQAGPFAGVDTSAVIPAALAIAAAVSTYMAESRGKHAKEE